MSATDPHPHTIIIAEAGVNHNGSMDLAVQLIHAAAEAGADYVKFQTFKSERIVAASAPKAEYQQANAPSEGNTQLEMLRALELTPAQFAELKAECDRMNIGFISTPFDFQSIEVLLPLGMEFWKIPSGEITNLPYLRRIAGIGQPIVMSTGMCEEHEVEQAVNVLCDNGVTRDMITLLHCNTQYPTPMADVNLRAMQWLRTLNCAAVGYSDHTQGIEIPIAAVAAGAKVIEKHFTLDRTLPGPDHKASLEPGELRAMIRAIRNVEMAMGDARKSVSDSERQNIMVARRSIVASRHIAAGEIFSEENLTVKRPGSGISPMMWDHVIGTKASRDFSPDDLITL
ncbi:MAG: N-acetylneuraminate synthase [Muribaculaceae bacterium]|nr:N-acetylneuraminate synthase [Muribaculaceae bacterium]